MLCSECDFDAKSRSGLANHTRKAHPRVGANERAMETTLAELKRMGRLEKVDEARVQALRSMAQALDLMPFNSQMWKEYRESIGGLTSDDGDSRSTSISELLDELSAPVRDPA